VFVTGLVLAAGASRQLGRPKQLLPYRGATLLEAAMDTARACGFDQLLVTLGGAAAQVRERVPLDGAEAVENPGFDTGCGSSISRMVAVVDGRADLLVLLLGDQPAVSPGTVRRLVAHPAGAPIGVCRYDDGLRHPSTFRREVFGDLAELHGDKAVWKLLHSGRYPTAEVAVDGPVPIDVDTWDDHRALLARSGDGAAP
jgi:molybdenum cofactor cytidylyltransferase